MTTLSLKRAQAEPHYRWIMLGTAALTSMLAYAMPVLTLPVLFREIADDLGLNLVQIGVIWGIGAVTGMFVVLIGGSVGDRFGTRRTLMFICLVGGGFGALRGLSNSFVTFLLTSLLFGLVLPALPVNLHKVAGQWFPREQLGFATGVVSAGFATGLMLGSLLGASVLSPLLGGWRNVLIVYGIVSVCISGLWYLVHPQEQMTSAAGVGGAHRTVVPLRQALRHVSQLRTVWLIGVGVFFFWACVRGFIGYLPLYLRGIGWEANRADSALATFYGISLLAAIPFSMLSDRLRVRRGYLIFAALILALGVGLLAVVQDNWIWAAVLLGGVIFDAFMAIYQATIMEQADVGRVYAGTALGFAAMFREAGGIWSPALGNSLSVFGASVPFLFWSSMAVIAAVIFFRLPASHSQ
ncbi:MAG: MFS transporter [Caldilineaceae bacterium]